MTFERHDDPLDEAGPSGVADAALELFEQERDRATSWLTTEQVGLGGVTPMDKIQEGAAQEVLDLIGRIEHGVF